DHLDRGFPLELVQSLGGNFAAGELVPRALEVRRLRKAPDGRRPESTRHDHPPFPEARRAASVRRETFIAARSTGRYSRLAVGQSCQERSERMERAFRTPSATRAGSSSLVLRASTSPSATVLPAGTSGIRSQDSHTPTRS